MAVCPTFVSAMVSFQLVGEARATLDDKGRFVVPAWLSKQLEGEDRRAFYINRGFEKCLTLYPLSTWKRAMEELARLSMFSSKNRQFIRNFLRGAMQVQADRYMRVLIPAHLKEYAGIERDIVLVAMFDRIEIWAPEEYDKVMSRMSAEEFARLAEEVMKKEEGKQ